MIIPRVSQPPKDILPDYEAELVIVIGKAAKDVPEDKALDYVLGYTGANDVSFVFGVWLSSLTNLLFTIGLVPETPTCGLSMGLLEELWSVLFIHSVPVICVVLNKSLDNTNPLGPCLVSNKIITDPQNVLLKCTVNGQVLQDGTTAYVPYLSSSLHPPTRLTPYKTF